jgi:high-affinity Fe2+/Pb2+ permease
MVNEECMHLKFPKSFQRATAVLLASLHLSSAWAQTETQPDVSKAEKSVELIYQSSFQNYQRYSASDIQSWKQANDTVKDIGGWRAYAKEITQDQNEKPVVPVHSHGAHQ